MPRPTTPFPDTIIVSLEQEDTRDQFLQVNTELRDAASLEEPKKVAFYKLVETGIVEASADYTRNKK
jgi:hypothetical protein